MLSWITAAAFATTGGNALVIDWADMDPTDDTDWQLGTNWVGNAVPGAGVDVRFLIQNDTIDVNGIPVSVGQFYVNKNGQTFLDTGDSITATSLRFHEANAVDIHADLVISGQLYTTRKSDHETYHGSVSFGGIDMGQGLSTFNGPVTVTGPNGLEAFYSSISQGATGPTYVFNDTLTSANGGSITSNNGTRVSTVTAGASDTLSGLGDTLHVDAGGILDLAVAQTGATPYGTGSISVNAYGLLLGDTGTSTWGPGNHIDVKNDGILATTAGSTPTTGDIGVAVAWQGVTSAGTWTAGNDGSSVFRGLAVGGFNDSLSSTTLEAPAGAGHVEILVLPGLGTSGQSVDIVSLDGTGIANLHCIGNFRSNGGTLNPNALPNAVTTFNFIGEDLTTTQIVDLYNNFTVDSGQTINISGNGWAEVDPDNLDGSLTFSGNTQLEAGTTAFPPIATNPNTMLTFHNLSSLAIASNEIALLENLTPGQIATSGTPILTLLTTGSNNAGNITPQFDINTTDTPNLIEFMKKCNINVEGNNNNYADLRGEGLVIGDGKYLMGYSDSDKGIYLRADLYDAVDNPFGPAIISGISGAATMGIACNSDAPNDYLGIIIPVDAKGAKLMLNNDQAMTTAKSGNIRSTEAPNNKILLQGPITNTPEIDVRKGAVDFDPGVSVPPGVTLTVQNGATANLDTAVTLGTIGGNGTVNNASNLTFATISPGSSVGALDMNTFTMPNGATYDCEIGGNGGFPGGSPLAGTDHDVIDGATVTFNTAWTLNLVNTGLGVGDLDGSEVFTIIDASSTPGFIAPTITSTGFDISGVSVTQNGGNIEVTGLLVDAGGADPYDAWSGGMWSGTLGDDDPELDSDGGGLETGIEWVVGGDPTLGSDDVDNTPTVDNSDPDDFIFTFKRRDAAEADGNTAIMVEYGSDLSVSGWTDAEHGTAGVSIDDTTDLGGGFHEVSVSIPRTLATGDKLFARLKVTVTIIP
ncbi:MAG: hypothetical protein O3A87_05545 [Verrucomicrobia bacterium]|nr:hypothetical protein [Verrucomicrobiota bacterium]